MKKPKKKSVRRRSPQPSAGWAVLDAMMPPSYVTLAESDRDALLDRRWQYASNDPMLRFRGRVRILATNATLPNAIGLARELARHGAQVAITLFGSGEKGLLAWQRACGLGDDARITIELLEEAARCRP